MDSATALVLQEIGTDIVQTFAAVIVETFCFAVYTVLIIKAIRIHIRRGLGAPVNLIILIVLLIMYSMALVMWSFDLTNFVREAQTTLIRDPDLPLSEKYANALQQTFKLVAPEDLLYAYMSILGDGIVVWRVYALWCQTRFHWIIVVPIALLVGTLVSAFMLTFCVVRLGTQIVDGSFQHPAFCKNVQTASYSMTTVTTAVSTCLIAWKTWEYRQSIKAMVSSASMNRSTKAERILILLLESGVLYFIFFLIQVIGNIPGVETNPTASFMFYIYSFSTSVIVGIYPTVIIILAHSTDAVIDKAVSSTFVHSDLSIVKGSTQRSRNNGRSRDYELSSFTVNSRTHVDEEAKASSLDAKTHGQIIGKNILTL